MTENSMQEDDKKEKQVRDRSEVEVNLDLIVLKPTELLVLPDTPNIYLTQEKAEKLLIDLKDAIEQSTEGVIIRLLGKVNPRMKPADEDESMFLTTELKSERVRERNP